MTANTENITQRRKQEALEMAQLLYDIFMEKLESDTIKGGQNNAQSNSSN
jgi:hypothetical protein